MHRFTLKISVIAISVACSSMANADSTFNLGKIEVNATQPLPALDSATIDAQTMREENRETVAEAVDRLPGVTLSNIGGRSETIANIRGFDLRQVPVLIDGIPVYVPYDGYVDLARFTTFDVSEINVSKSFSSTLMGPNALGGAINLVSRRPNKELEGEVGVGYKTGDNTNSEGKRGWLNIGTNQGLWYGQFSTSYLQDDAFSLSDDFEPTAFQGTGVRNNSSRKDSKVNIKLGLTPNETDEYAIGYAKQDGQKNTPPYVGNNTDVTPRFWQWPFWDKESIYFISHTALNHNNYIKTRLYYDTFENQINSFDDETYTTQSAGYAFSSIYDDHTYGGSIEYGHTVGRHQLKFAGHYKFDEHTEQDVGEPKGVYRDRTTSYGFEDTITLTDKLFIVAGASYDRRDTIKALDYDSSRGFIDFEKQSNYAFNPQIGLFAELDDANDMRVTISQKSRFPTIKDRYSFRFGRALPNPDLDQEKAKTIELGWTHKLKQYGRLESTVFYSDITDLIQQVSLSDDVIAANNLRSDATQFQNVGKVRSRGVELSADFWHGDWSFGSNYSFLDRDNLSSELELTNVPKHKLFGYVTWQVTQPLSVSFTSQYESERINTTDGARKSSAFTTAGLRATYQHIQGFTARVGLENMFDKDYSYDEGYPEAGRTYYANLSYQF